MDVSEMYIFSLMLMLNTSLLYEIYCIFLLLRYSQYQIHSFGNILGCIFFQVCGNYCYSEQTRRITSFPINNFENLETIIMLLHWNAHDKRLPTHRCFSTHLLKAYRISVDQKHKIALFPIMAYSGLLSWQYTTEQHWYFYHTIQIC